MLKVTAPLEKTYLGNTVYQALLENILSGELPSGAEVSEVALAAELRVSRTPVHGVVAVKSERDIATALAYAKANGLTVSAAGVKHSMGGQAFRPGGVMLDMRGMIAIKLDPAARMPVLADERAPLEAILKIRRCAASVKFAGKFATTRNR